MAWQDKYAVPGDYTVSGYRTVEMIEELIRIYMKRLKPLMTEEEEEKVFLYEVYMLDGEFIKHKGEVEHTTGVSLVALEKWVQEAGFGLRQGTLLVAVPIESRTSNLPSLGCIGRIEKDREDNLIVARVNENSL